MKINSLICGIFLVSFSQNLYAASADQVGANTSKLSGESEKNRQDKGISVSAFASPEVTSNGTLMAESGVNVGIHLSPNFVLLFDGAKGTGGNISQIFGVQDSLIQSRLGVHLQSFLGNSFNVKLGVQQRTMEQRVSGSFFAMPITSRTLNATTTDVVLRIGNQWQWHNFNFAIDWIGYAKPVAGQITKDSMASTSDSSNTDPSRDLLLSTTYVSALVVSLGTSF